MKRIYISGKISGLDIEAARAKFKRAEDYCNSQGKKAVNPMNIKYPIKLSWFIYMTIDILLLLTCNEIYLQRDWIDSKGSKIEYNIAKFLQYQIIIEQ